MKEVVFMTSQPQQIQRSRGENVFFHSMSPLKRKQYHLVRLASIQLTVDIGTCSSFPALLRQTINLCHDHISCLILVRIIYHHISSNIYYKSHHMASHSCVIITINWPVLHCHLKACSKNVNVFKGPWLRLSVCFSASFFASACVSMCLSICICVFASACDLWLKRSSSVVCFLYVCIKHVCRV